MSCIHNIHRMRTFVSLPSHGTCIVVYPHVDCIMPYARSLPLHPSSLPHALRRLPLHPPMVRRRVRRMAHLPIIIRKRDPRCCLHDSSHHTPIHIRSDTCNIQCIVASIQTCVITTRTQRAVSMHALWCRTGIAAYTVYPPQHTHTHTIHITQPAEVSATFSCACVCVCVCACACACAM